MALQAHETNFGAREHSRIRGPVRFMARLTAFKTKRRMFERERTTLVAVALDAARIVRRESLQHRGLDTSVRVMAIDAAHVTFRQSVMEGFLELRPLVQVTAAALLINGFVFADNERLLG